MANNVRLLRFALKLDGVASAGSGAPALLVLAQAVAVVGFVVLQVMGLNAASRQPRTTPVPTATR
jgi:hypothetical protein